MLHAGLATVLGGARWQESLALLWPSWRNIYQQNIRLVSHTHTVPSSSVDDNI